MTIKLSMAPTIAAVPFLSPIKMQIAAMNDQMVIGSENEADSRPGCRTKTGADAQATDKNVVLPINRPKLN